MTPQKNKSQKAFTLIELLVVITIIIILAALTIGALPGVNNVINRKQTNAFVVEISAALENYRSDFGGYPASPAAGVSSTDLASREAEGLLGAGILYRHLTGDFDEDGELDDDSSVKAYLSKATFLESQSSKSGRSISVPSGARPYGLADPFNSPIRYLCEPPNKVNKQTYNPTFDIWSIGKTLPSEATEPKIQNRYITNWKSN